MKILNYLGGLWNQKKLGTGTTQTDNDALAIALKQTYADHPMRNMTPAHMSSILEQAERGNIVAQHEMFLDMEERDPHLHAEMSKRKRTVIGLPRHVVPPVNGDANDTLLASRVNEIIESMLDFDDLLLNLLDAIGHGFSCSEISWAYKDGLWLPNTFTHRPQYWFQLDTKTRTEIRLRDNGVDGQELWPFGWIVHKHAAKSGELSRSGLFRVLAWPWLMKQYSLRDLAEYLEIYGLPVKIGKYPRGAPDDDKDRLYKALQQLGRNVSGVMPDDMTVDFLKESLGSADPFMRMIEYSDSAISKAILGQTLSSTASATGMGSGVAALHGDVRQDLLESDAAQLAGTLTTQLIYPIMAINGLGNGKRFSYSFDTSTPENLLSFADSISKLATAGVHISEKWIREKLAIPEPKDDDAVIGPAAQPSISANSLAALLAPQMMATDKGATNPISTSSTNKKPSELPLSEYVDSQVPRLAEEINPLVDAVLMRVRDMLDESSDLKDFHSRLKDWFPESESLDMAVVLQSAFIASELAGMSEVSDDK